MATRQSQPSAGSSSEDSDQGTVQEVASQAKEKVQEQTQNMRAQAQEKVKSSEVV